MSRRVTYAMYNRVLDNQEGSYIIAHVFCESKRKNRDERWTVAWGRHPEYLAVA
jgi:hypothetical protein